MVDPGQWLGIAVTLLQVCSPQSYLISFVVRMVFNMAVSILLRLVRKFVRVRIRVRRRLTRGQHQYMLILEIKRNLS